MTVHQYILKNYFGDQYDAAVYQLRTDPFSEASAATYGVAFTNSSMLDCVCMFSPDNLEETEGRVKLESAIKNVFGLCKLLHGLLWS